MRKLLWFTLGFGAACAFGAYVYSGILLLVEGAVLLAVSGMCLWLLRRHGAQRTVAMLCVGLSVGLIWYQLYDSLYLSGIRKMDEKTISVTMTATDYSYETDYGVAVEGTVSVSGKSCRVMIYVDEDTALSPGDSISGTFRFRYTSTGGEEDPTYHRGEGTFLLAYPKGKCQIVPAKAMSWEYAPAYLRERLLSTVEEIFPTDTMAFAKALLLGDTNDLSYETDSDLKISGIRHVVAVSGLHVSILFSLVYLLTARRRVLTAVLGIPVLVLFAAMAGFTPSILRACIMQLLMLLSLSFRREYDPPTALSFAAFVMLTVNPLTITSVGFQLSVGSVAGILLFSGKIHAWLSSDKRLGSGKGKSIIARLLRYFKASVSVTLSAMVFTTPLTAWYFGTVSLIGAVTNLLCLWVVTFLFCGIIIACALGLFSVTIGTAVAWGLGWLIRGILGVAGFLADVPFAAVYTASVYITAWLVLCYVLLCVFLVSKKKQPVVLACCIVLGLCAALLASWLEPTLDDYRVTMLDVGQGQCVLLQSEGRTYMVDCGGDGDEATADTAAAFLAAQGITRLDGMILTHYDRDHVGGAAYLLSRVAADTLILPVGEDADGYKNALTAAHGDRPIYASQDVQITWGDASITVFASQDTKSSNESSLCVLFQAEKCDILITGDRSSAGEIMLTIQRQLPALEALVVGHHGADSSTSDRLLEVTKPEIALISVGADNSYGHPAASVLERLKKYGCEIRRTDLEGTIILRGVSLWQSIRK